MWIERNIIHIGVLLPAFFFAVTKERNDGRFNDTFFVLTWITEWHNQFYFVCSPSLKSMRFYRIHQYNYFYRTFTNRFYCHAKKKRNGEGGEEEEQVSGNIQNRHQKH